MLDTGDMVVLPSLDDEAIILEVRATIAGMEGFRKAGAAPRRQGAASGGAPRPRRAAGEGAPRRRRRRGKKAAAADGGGTEGSGSGEDSEEETEGGTETGAGDDAGGGRAGQQGRPPRRRGSPTRRFPTIQSVAQLVTSWRRHTPIATRGAGAQLALPGSAAAAAAVAGERLAGEGAAAAEAAAVAAATSVAGPHLPPSRVDALAAVADGDLSPPLPVIVAMRLIQSLLWMAEEGAPLPRDASKALIRRFDEGEVSDAFRWLRALGWLNYGAARRPFQMSGPWRARLQGDEGERALMRGAAAARGAMDAALAAADEGREAPGGGDGDAGDEDGGGGFLGSGAGQAAGGRQQQKDGAGGDGDEESEGGASYAGMLGPRGRSAPRAVLVGPPSSKADVGGSLVLDALCRAATGELQLALELRTPDPPPGARQPPGAASGGGSGQGAVLQRRPVLEVLASRAAAAPEQPAAVGGGGGEGRDLFVYLAAPANDAPAGAEGGSDGARPPSRKRPHSAAEGPAPDEAAGQAGPQQAFLPYAVGELASVREEADKACLAEARRLAAADPSHQQPQQQPKKRSRGGAASSAGDGKADAGQAAEDGLAAVLAAVRAAGTNGITEADAEKLILSPPSSSSASSAPAQAPLTAHQLLQLLLRYGLVRAVGAWSIVHYVASESSQRLLSHPVPPERPQPAREPAGGGAAAAAEAAGGERGASPTAAQTDGEEAAARGGKDGRRRAGGASRPPPDPAAVREAAGEEAAVRPWLDHDGRVNAALWRALVQRAMGVALRNPGIPEPELVAHLDLITPQDGLQLLRELEATGQLLVKLLPPGRRSGGATARPPSLLLGRRGGGGGGGGAGVNAATSSKATVRHFWPAVGTAYLAHTLVLPQGCRA